MSNNEKFIQALTTLPEDLHPVFKELVEDYRYAAHVRYGKQYVSYVVLADLIRVGWRRSASDITEKSAKS